MQLKGKIFLQVLLNRYHRGSVEEIYQMLPKEEAEELRTLTTASSDIQPAIAQASERLQKLHYSWLITYLNALPKQQQTLTIATLPKPFDQKIAEKMQIELPELPINSHMRSFFLDKFYHSIPHEEILPAEYLPERPLSPLLTLEKKALVTVIDLLGVYDFAESIRKVVDKRHLKSLTSCLSPLQQRFLRHCLHRKEKLSTTKTVLEKWDRDPKNLRKTLHRRGIMRLAIATSKERNDFHWHLKHTLDTGRAALLEKFLQKAFSTEVVDALIQQLLNLQNFLKKGKK